MEAMMATTYGSESYLLCPACSKDMTLHDDNRLEWPENLWDCWNHGEGVWRTLECEHCGAAVKVELSVDLSTVGYPKKK
jgi:hypothetical protein